MALPFSQTIVRDTFTRANGASLGANWTALSDAIDTGTFGIVSNTAQSTVGANAASFWNANTFTANQYAQCILNVSALGTNSHGGGPVVRCSAGGNFYRFFVNTSGANGSQTLAIQSNVAGTFNTLVSTNTGTVTSGDLLRLEVVGTTLTAYQNGVQVLQTTDANLSSGSPGVCGFMAAASPTFGLTTWEGGSLLWTRQGTVIAKTVGNGGGASEPTVLYEANPQILSANPDGKIFKMWYTNGWTSPVAISYAESANGITWTQYGSNPVISDGSNAAAHAFCLHKGNTYYEYVGNDLAAGTGTAAQLDLWQSSNGVTGWTKTNTAVLPVGGVGTWDHTTVADPLVWVEGANWFMLYQGRLSPANYSVGLATSSDGVTWTKYVSNPVITAAGESLNGKTITKNGGLYYLWGGNSPSGLLPTDIAMFSSPDLHTWTACAKNPNYIRVLSDEGANLPASGQVADVSLVEVSGTTYMFYDAIDVQSVGSIHINMATAPFTLLQLPGIIFGANIIAGNCGVAGATISYSGAASGSVTSDSSGNYVLPITANGVYTITPSLSGHVFSPPSSSPTVSSADITGLNFQSTGGGDESPGYDFSFRM